MGRQWLNKSCCDVADETESGTPDEHSAGNSTEVKQLIDYDPADDATHPKELIDDDETFRKRQIDDP